MQERREARENGEGADSPKDKGRESGEGDKKPDAKPEAPEQAEIRELKQKLTASRDELHETRFRLSRTSEELGKARAELREAGDERRTLVDTVSRQGRQLEAKDAEIKELRAPTPALERREKDLSAQAKDAADKPSRRSWFPSEKLSAAASAGVSAAGAAGVALHQITGTTESAIVAVPGSH
ncbi:MAG: hypothetical protein J2P25_16930 [Nocardiopsaceae bacterium]|nr:hypothetical protein [Nocardiopsaceae bacterium]